MTGRRIVVLGGGGGIGSVAARALACSAEVANVVVADVRLDAAARTVASIGDDRFEAATVDVADPSSLGDLIDGAAVVVNCVGPFYRFGPPTLATAIDRGVTYVDVCDDLDATRAMLEMDDRAREAGVVALVGMGTSPGLANVFVKLASEWFFDELHSAEIMHIHGGEPDEGPAVLKHRIHAMVSDVPLFVDGELVDVRMLEPSGERFVRIEEFPGVGSSPVFPYPHPETITLPRAFPGLRTATNLGVVYPLPYFERTQELVRAGMASDEPVDVAGSPVAPIDVMVAMLRRERPGFLSSAGVDGPGGCLKVVVAGTKDGEEHRYEFALSSTSAGAGEGTGIPAAIGALLAWRGALDERPGVSPPEAIVPIEAFLELTGAIVSGMDLGGTGGVPLTVTHVAPDGARADVPFSFS